MDTSILYSVPIAPSRLVQLSGTVSTNPSVSTKPKKKKINKMCLHFASLLHTTGLQP